MNDTSLEPRLEATGTIHVSLVLNFRHFVDRKQKKDFDRLRGSPDYQQTLDALAEHVIEIIDKRKRDQIQEHYPFFLQETQEQELQDIAVDINIFRHQTAKVAFTPVYWLNEREGNEFKASSTLEDRLPTRRHSTLKDFENKLREEWGKWERKGIQLTRDGIVHIRLEQVIKEPAPLLNVLEMVVGLQEDPAKDKQAIHDFLDADNLDVARDHFDRLQFREQLDRSIQWEIAMSLIELFIEKSFEKKGDTFSFPNLDSNVGFSELRLYKGGTRAQGKYEHTNSNNRKIEDPIYPLHDRYVTYVFKELRDGDRVVTWADLNPEPKIQNIEYGTEITCLLEGVMIKEEGENKVKRFPELKEREIYQGLKVELSSWEAELCLLSQDNAVIYYYFNPQIHFSNRPNVRYDDYWGCIMRGLEYILGLRLLALMVANNSTEDLDLLADLMSKPDTKHNRARRESKKIEELRQRVATNTRLIGHLRDATSPLFIASANYATRKFNRFIKISGLKHTIGNAENDIRAINDFLRHHDTSTEQKSDRRRNLRFTLVAIFLSFFELLSFLVAWFNLGDQEKSDFKKSVLSTLVDVIIDTDVINIFLIVLQVVTMMIALYMLWKLRQPIWQKLSSIRMIDKLE